MQLSIIIVNYNVKYFLEHCLLSVLKACKNIDAEILVVDNNSIDGSEEYFSSKFDSVKFFWNKTNAGFGKANNSVLKYATGDYILFLNPDTIVPEDCFTKSISFFQSHKDCGAIGVRMIDGSGTFLKESKRCLPTPSAGFFKMIGLATLFPSSTLFAKYYAGHLPEKQNNITDVLAGAFMMLSKRAIEITKGFDEDFFMYGEDIDLSYRITKAGLNNYYLGETSIIHFKGESTQKKSKNYISNFYGAMKRFVNKHYNNKLFLKVCMLAFINLGEMFASVKNIFNTKAADPKKQSALNILLAENNSELEKLKSIIKNTSHTISKTEVLDFKNIAPQINTVLFCEADMSNSIIIETLQTLPKNVTALIYESGAESIIGSNNKNERGIFISAL